MNGWIEEPLPGAEEDAAIWEALTRDFGPGSGWGEWTPQRGQARPAAGNYEGVGDDNPYLAP